MKCLPFLSDVELSMGSKQEAVPEAVGFANGSVKPADGEDYLSIRRFHRACCLSVLICYSGSQAV